MHFSRGGWKPSEGCCAAGRAERSASPVQARPSGSRGRDGAYPACWVDGPAALHPVKRLLRPLLSWERSDAPQGAADESSFAVERETRMIFPRGRAVYEHLNTSFTHLDAMLNELKTDLFSGLRPPHGARLRRSRPPRCGPRAERDRRRGGAAPRRGQGRGRGSCQEPRARRHDQRLPALGGNDPTPGRPRQQSGPVQGPDERSDQPGSPARQPEGATPYRLHRRPVTRASRDGHDLLAGRRRAGGDAPPTRDHQRRPECLGGADPGRGVRRGRLYGARAQIAAPETETQPPRGQDRQEQLGVWQEVLKTVETSVDSPTKPGTFVAAFKRASIELADAYPFLDPFAAEFEYRDGQIRYDGQASGAESTGGSADASRTASARWRVNRPSRTCRRGCRRPSVD